MVKIQLQAFDLFPKLSDDLKISRPSSGLLSVISFVVITLLVLGELVDYNSNHWVSYMGVDTRGVEGHIAITLDITFPGMKCGDFGLDVVDITGELQLGAESEVLKIPEPGGGCTMKGTMIAHKVDGEFHMAFGRIAKAAPGQHTRLTATQAHSTGHIHQFSMAEIGWFNASHIVNHVFFSLADQAFEHNTVKDLGVQFPLDGLQYIVEHDSARVTYFIKIVPTTYIFANGEKIEMFQISHKQHVFPVIYSRSFRQPGIFFKYEISPYHVTNIESSKPLSILLSSCCALVGGVYVVVGFSSAYATIVFQSHILRFIAFILDKLFNRKQETDARNRGTPYHAPYHSTHQN